MAKTKKEDSAQSTHSRTGAGAKGDGGLDIRVDSHNYRLHPDKNKDLIRRSLQENGAGRSIVVDNTGEAIGGSGVLEQAEKLGIKRKIVETNGDELVVVVRKDISPDDPRRKRLAVADNAATDISEWDAALLSADFTEEELAGFDIELPKMPDENDYSGGQGAGDVSEAGYNISYEIVFSNEQEQEKWFGFVKMLKRKFPDDATVSARILRVAEEWMRENAD